MLRNFLKVAIRNLFRNKTYSFINIFGLGLGLATGFILLLWVANEYSMNRYHQNAERIYQINGKIKSDAQEEVWELVQGPIAVSAKQNLSDVEAITRCKFLSDKQPLRVADKKFVTEKYGYAENEFFQIFDFPVLKGNPAAPFTKGLSVVLTETAAKKYFGTEEPLGQPLRFRDTVCYVSAVLKDVPQNSSLQFELLFSLDVVRAKFRGNGDWKTIDEDWGNFSFSTFFLLREGGSTQRIRAALRDALQKAHPGSSLTEYQARPLKDFYLYKPDGTKGRLIMVEIFSVIAVFVLLIAAINYINLVTAKATQRMKEIGVRKIVGAAKQQLFRQFFVETGVLLTISCVMALLLVQLLLPLYQQVSGNMLPVDAGNALMWKVIAGVVLGVWIITGSYPAFLLSSFHPLKSLKNEGGLSRIGLFRKSLIVLQFVVSLTLLLGTVFIHRQMDFIQNRNLNLAVDHVLEIPAYRLDDSKSFVNELSNLPGVSRVTVSNSLLFEGTNSTTDLDWKGKPKETSLSISHFNVDKEFLSFFGISLKEGTDFRNTTAGTPHYILNETAVRQMGLKDPVGQVISFHNVPGTVIGIVKDFHFESLHKELGPAILQYNPEDAAAVYLQVSPQQTQAVIVAAHSLWQKFEDGFPMEYKFLDDQLAAVYDKENRAKILFDAFAFITLFISCLGLFGLATHNAQRRVKEIGVRKVLGARIADITVLLSKEFLLLLLLAVCIAVPVVHYGMNVLLQHFACRTGLHWWVFAAACVTAIALAMCTVVVQSARAAAVNPVKNLRTE